MIPKALLIPAISAIVLAAAFALTGQEPGAPAASQVRIVPPLTLFRNVRIFDGKSDRLSAPSHVLVRGNLIEKISTAPLPTDPIANLNLIADPGRNFTVIMKDGLIYKNNKP